MNDDRNASANHARHEDDFHRWAIEQAQLLRDGRLAEADVAEEIESFGRGERRIRLPGLAHGRLSGPGATVSGRSGSDYHFTIVPGDVGQL